MNQQNYSPNTNYAILLSSTLAIVSLISGILGFVMLPIIGSIVALWAGYAARSETRSVPPRASGDGLATAGIIMGWIQIGLAVVGVCCAIAYFGFFAALIASSGNH
jgi:uncharacterized protein DUF4190